MTNKFQQKSKQISLYDVLKSSYKNKDDQTRDLLRYGYLKDGRLSNHNEQIYFNPKSKKLLNVVAGTHNIKDWGTDIYLGLGHLKDTNRYNEAKTVLNQAKTKYKGFNTTIAGHSLGGAISGYIAGKDDKVITYNSGYTIGSRTRPNSTNFRTHGDIVSVLGNRNKEVKTLNNNNKSSNIISNVLSAHNVDNLKKSNIYV